MKIRFVLAFASFLASPVAAQTFGPSTHHTVSNAKRIATGDVNSDGFPDVLVGANFFPFGMNLFSGGPGGVLTPALPPGGFFPSANILVDLDGDGDLDVAAVSTGSSLNPGGNLVKIPSNGWGAFGALSVLANTVQSEVLTAADVNADGRVDIIVGNGFPAKNVQVFLGLGGGNFAAGVTYPTFHGPMSIAVADMDGDGKRDLVVGNNGTKNVSLLFGTGGGVFAPMVNYPTTGDVRSIAVGDVDGDSLLDVVGACRVTNPGLAVLRGLGNGVLSASTLYPGGSQGFELELVDADGNGTFDALVADSISSKVLVFSGTGGGNFALTSNMVTAIDVLNVKAVDLNLDGRVDAVSSSFSGGVLSVMLQTPLTFPSVVPYGTGSPGCFGQIALAASKEPRIDTPDYAYLETNAPRNSLGILIASDVKDVAGSDPFAIGILLHCDLFAATEIYAFDIWTDGTGTGRVLSPLPNNPFLIGKTYYKSVVHVENPGDGLDCGSSVFTLVSSRGLDVTIQP